MADYTVTQTAVTGQPLPAANFNLGIRDNFAALGSAWTAYTPVWGSTGAAPAIGNGSIVGRYRKFGKTLDLHVLLTMGTTTTYGAAAWKLSLPAGMTAANKQLLRMHCELASHYHGLAYIINGGADVFPIVDNAGAGGVMAFPTGAIPGAWATGHTLNIMGQLELT